MEHIMHIVSEWISLTKMKELQSACMLVSIRREKRSMKSSCLIRTIRYGKKCRKTCSND